MGADLLSEDSIPTNNTAATGVTLAECCNSTRSDSQQSDAHSLNMDEDPNDSGIESNICNTSNGYQPLAGTASGGNDAAVVTAASHRLERGDSNSSDVFDSAADSSFSFTNSKTDSSGAVGGVVRQTSSHGVGASRANARVRSVSTSLAQHPIVDNDLQDFHEHNLEAGNHPLNIK